MLHNRRNRILTILLCVVLLVGVVGWNIVPDYSWAMDANWGISLPWKALCKEVYEQDSGASFHGDGIRYHVFSYRYEDYIDLMFAWSPVEKETIFHPSVSEAAEEWLDEIEVPTEKRPDYAACSSWHTSKRDNSEIIIFWDSEQNLLYVVEHFL